MLFLLAAQRFRGKLACWRYGIFFCKNALLKLFQYILLFLFISIAIFQLLY